MKFRNEYFNDIYEVIKRMDSLDDYLMLQVSALNPGKDDMTIVVMTTGRTGRKPVINKVAAEAILITAMERSDDLKRLLTDTVKHYEQLQAFKRRQKP